MGNKPVCPTGVFNTQKTRNRLTPYVADERGKRNIPTSLMDQLSLNPRVMRNLKYKLPLHDYAMPHVAFSCHPGHGRLILIVESFFSFCVSEDIVFRELFF